MSPEALRLACRLLDRADDALCDAADAPPTLESVDALARLRLAASRRGCRLHVRNASRELRELVALAGLDDVLGV